MNQTKQKTEQKSDKKVLVVKTGVRAGHGGHTVAID